MKANTRGIDLFYNDVGQGLAIVFLHGYPFNRSMWRAQIDFFAARDYRCIAPDLRGLGETSDKLQFVDDAVSAVLQRQAEAPRPLTTSPDMARHLPALTPPLTVK